MAAPLTPDDPRRLGAYRLAGRLGEGGQGVVYLAYGPGGEQVALKLLLSGDPETRARLARELSALESVAPFCTARVLTVSVDGPRPYVVSEFVDGPSLQERIRERGPLRGGELERLVVGTATALAAVHAAGIVHRDFKPANVLLGPDGPRVVDFGIARADDAATMTSGIVGTPAYLAPEQIGGAPASAASDVFAWAATMLCAASGRPPFGADTLPAVLHRILTGQPDLSVLPPGLAGLIGSCLEKDPARRPTARSLMVALVDPHGRGPSSADVPTGPADRPTAHAHAHAHAHADTDTDTDETHPSVAAGGTSRRRRGVFAGTVLAAASLVIAGATAAWFLPGDQPSSGSRSGGERSPAPSSPGTDPPGGAESTERPLPYGLGGTTDPFEPTAEPRRPSATAPPAPDGRIPSSFAGRWGGHIKPSIAFGLREHDVEIDLPAGGGSGTWKEPTSGCTGTLDLTKVTATALGFLLRPDGDCVPGTLTLTREGTVLVYHWVDGLNLGTSYDGDLSKR